MFLARVACLMIRFVYVQTLKEEVAFSVRSHTSSFWNVDACERGESRFAQSRRATQSCNSCSHAIRFRKSFLKAVKDFQCSECSRSIASLSLGNEFSFGREGPKRLRSSGAQVVSLTLVETEDEVEGISEGF